MCPLVRKPGGFHLDRRRSLGASASIMASALLQSFQEGQGSASGPISRGPLARVMRTAPGTPSPRNAQDLVEADNQQASQCDDDHKRMIAIANGYGRCMGDLCQQGLQTLQEEIFDRGDTILAAIAIQHALENGPRARRHEDKRHVQLRPGLC